LWRRKPFLTVRKLSRRAEGPFMTLNEAIRARRMPLRSLRFGGFRRGHGRIIAEGATDQNVIENILCGFFQSEEEEPVVNPVQPPRKTLMQHRGANPSLDVFVRNLEALGAAEPDAGA
jgi:hypothetical protein